MTSVYVALLRFRKDARRVGLSISTLSTDRLTTTPDRLRCASSTSSSVAGVTAAGDADAAREALPESSTRARRAFSRAFALFFSKACPEGAFERARAFYAPATPRAAFGADAEVTYPRTVGDAPAVSMRSAVGFFSTTNMAS